MEIGDANVPSLLGRVYNYTLGWPIVSADWSATCKELPRNVPNKFKGSRIEMKWSEDNF
ncbi:hypothetical protein PVK06_036296 [Gossypium arboreum]|uniref:Uncharacterized protein n=1 Tax=Gossypium arboreum TaxID=29729 RepID=A0ABR0NJ64_GOSAR|nr:hypothetical protein PVK06_036296 [Gossypium arboreum]